MQKWYPTYKETLPKGRRICLLLWFWSVLAAIRKIYTSTQNSHLCAIGHALTLSEWKIEPPSHPRCQRCLHTVHTASYMWQASLVNPVKARCIIIWLQSVFHISMETSKTKIARLSWSIHWMPGTFRIVSIVGLYHHFNFAHETSVGSEGVLLRVADDDTSWTSHPCNAKYERRCNARWILG